MVTAAFSFVRDARSTVRVDTGSASLTTRCAAYRAPAGGAAIRSPSQPARRLQDHLARQQSLAASVLRGAGATPPSRGRRSPGSGWSGARDRECSRRCVPPSHRDRAPQDLADRSKRAERHLQSPFRRSRDFLPRRRTASASDRDGLHLQWTDSLVRSRGTARPTNAATRQSVRACRGGSMHQQVSVPDSTTSP